MTPSRKLASWTLLCLALAGCGESRLTVELRDQTRDSDLAAARITAGKLYSSNDDRLLAGMEQGLLAHLQGDAAGSDQQLEAIAPLVDAHPEWGPRIVKGAWWRSAINLRFFEALRLNLSAHEEPTAA